MNNELGMRNNVEEAFRPPSWRPKGRRYIRTWSSGAVAFLATFIILFSLFLIPNATNAATDCASALGGVCQNPSSPCDGNYEPGHCGSGAPVCCVPGRGIQGAGGLISIFGRESGFEGAPREPEVIIGEILQGAMLLIGVLFGILIIYGGFLWMIARGNEETVKKAIDILQTAIIGFIVVASAYAISDYVITKVIQSAY